MAFFIGLILILVGIVTSVFVLRSAGEARSKHDERDRLERP